jgi:hypothetical protein
VSSDKVARDNKLKRQNQLNNFTAKVLGKDLGATASGIPVIEVVEPAVLVPVEPVTGVT